MGRGVGNREEKRHKYQRKVKVKKTKRRLEAFMRITGPGKKGGIFNLTKGEKSWGWHEQTMWKYLSYLGSGAAGSDSRNQQGGNNKAWKLTMKTKGQHTPSNKKRYHDGYDLSVRTLKKGEDFTKKN